MNIFWTLFAVHLTTAGAAVNFDNTPRNFIESDKCIQAMEQTVVRMKEQGKFSTPYVHVVCILAPVDVIPEYQVEVKNRLMRKYREDQLMKHTAPWDGAPATRPVLPTIDPN